jgi:hypothetical protein
MLDKAFAAKQLGRLSGHPKFHFLSESAQDELLATLIRVCLSEHHAERTLGFWLRHHGCGDQLPMPADIAAAAAEVAPPPPTPGPCQRCHATRFENSWFLITYVPTQSGAGRTRQVSEIWEETYGQLLTEGVATSPLEMGTTGRMVQVGLRPCRACEAGGKLGAARLAAAIQARV